MVYPWQERHPGPILRSTTFIGVAALVLFITYFAIFTPWLGLYAHNFSIEQAGQHSRTPPVTCRGPRGLPVSYRSQDVITPSKLDLEYPAPQLGSHKELGLEELWMTASDRYGPYGFWDEHENPPVASLDWHKIDWGAMQDDCFALNAFRFSNTSTIGEYVNRGLLLQTAERNSTPPSLRDQNLTGRTALVLRLWDEYEYTKEDFWHMRSIIVEAALGSGGEYAVFLLVDAKDRDIYSSVAAYQTVLNELVPAEFRSIALLFNSQLLDSWYSKVEPYELKEQMLMPTQLFAHFVDGFDHYWNLEADVRFSSDVRIYLDAMSKFARDEPRKQSRERSSFNYMPTVHGTYPNFTSKVDAAMFNKSVSPFWGPQRIPDIVPIGPEPPTNEADDDFTWGVGEDADVIVTSPCKDVLNFEAWIWRHWTRGFEDPEKTLRTHCPPAVGRGSWNLYNAVHWAQAEQGLAVPAEATLPSFAMWHGMKLSFPPQPSFFQKPQDLEEIDRLFNGGPNISSDGLSAGKAFYDNSRPDIADTKTWWHFSPFPRRLVDQWMYGVKEGEQLEYLLRKTDDGRIWMPVLALHPVKNEHQSVT